MDSFSRALYELRFELKYVKTRGDEFQSFFSSIMEKCHPGDFQRVRPWGKFGDRKNDGYLPSEKSLFQVYAPNEMDEASTLDKIDEDFTGAFPYWKQYFDKWIFVHNSQIGLSAGVSKRLLDLTAIHRPLAASAWGYEELRQRAFRLNATDLASLLGPALTHRSLSDLRYSDIARVIARVGGLTAPLASNIRPVPMSKLTANALSSNVQVLLTAGMIKSSQVRNFFRDYHDPLLGDRVAETLRQKYVELRDSDIYPDQIYMELVRFVGGEGDSTADQMAAVLAIVAYFFEQCEIFEEPRKG